MPLSQLVMLLLTQALLWAGLGFALYWTHQCYRDFPEKRWRMLGIMVWLSFSTATSIISTVATLIGCPTLPVMRIVVWVDRTALFVGFLGVGVTGYQVTRFYRGLGNAD